MNEDKSPTSTTTVLQLKAPFFAKLPKFMRDWDPKTVIKAAWVVITLVFIVACRLFWLTVDMSGDLKQFNSKMQKIDKLSEDMAEIKPVIVGPQGLAAWRVHIEQVYEDKAIKQEEAQNKGTIERPK